MMIIKNVMLNDEKCDIEIKDGKIANIGKLCGDGIDADGLYAIPGLIDIHSHGCLGIDTMDAKLDEMAEFFAKHGTLTWYPTTEAEAAERTEAACAANTNVRGSNIPGFHIESSYISKKFKGAQNENHIRKPDLEEFKKLKNAKLITIAPELDGALDFIKNCGCVVCLGHSGATYEQAKAAAEAGANCLTHTFNAMTPFHHREPGLIGAALTENMYVQVIADGLHLHKSVVLALYRMFGSDRMVLISDCIRATGIGDGEYILGGLPIDVKDGVARTKDGALAGSTFTLMDCVKSAISMGIDKDEAIKMATETPANLMGLNKGRIKEGYDADILLCDDELNIKQIIINGEIFE